VRATCIDSNGQNFHTLQDLQLEYNNVAIISAYGGCLHIHGASQGWMLTDCTIRRGAGPAICFEGTITGFTLTSCSLTFNGNAGVLNDTYTGNTNLTVTLCTIADNGWQPVVTDGTLSGIVWGMDSGEVSFCTFARNGAGGQPAPSEHGMYLASTLSTATARIHHCTSTDHPKGSGFKSRQSVTIDHCTSEGNENGIVYEPNTNAVVLAHHNIYNTNRFAGFYQLGSGSATLSLYHETVYNEGGTIGAAVFVTASMAFLNIKNCIIWAAAGRSNVVFTANQAGTVSINYNLYWRGDGTPAWASGGAGKTWAQWQALGYDASGKTMDPLFANAGSGDFTLEVSSPARNAGVIIPGINDAFVGTAPDMGALEYQVGAALAGRVVSGDLIHETTTSTGEGDLTLLGPAANRRAFSVIAGVDDLVEYAIHHQTEAEFETGLARWGEGSVLTRLVAYQSSSIVAGAYVLVDFSAGTKDVICTLPAMRGGLPCTSRNQKANALIPPSMSSYVSSTYEIGVNASLELGVGSTLEIG
jgi:hypothetical protein